MKIHYIKEIRRALGYTQKRLAQKLKVTQGAVSHWENGICQPCVTALLKLDKLLVKAQQKSKHY